MEKETIIIVSTFGASTLLLAVAVLTLICQVSKLKQRVNDLQNTSKIRVQKLSVDTSDRNHAFHNPGLVPDEELSKRGYSMYVADVESGRPAERQTGGQLVEELHRELEARHQRQQAPPFLLQSIQENKRRTRDLANPAGNLASSDNATSTTRQSDTNPNFIY